MSRKRGPDGQDLRTPHEWLEDARKEEVALLLGAAERIRWQMEQTIERLRRDGVNTNLNDGLTIGLVDGAIYDRHLRLHCQLQEVARRFDD